MAKSNQKKKKNVKVEAAGEAHIQASFNNIIVSLTNNFGIIKLQKENKMKQCLSIMSRNVHISQIKQISIPLVDCRVTKRKSY